MTGFIRRLRARIKYRHFERDLAREIETHRAMTQEELEASGAAPLHARERAARALGNVTLAREDARSVWIARWLEQLWQDVRYAARQIARHPTYSLGTSLVLAIGVASSTVAFSALNAVLLRPWPVASPEQIVVVRPAVGPDGQYATISLAEARYLQQHATTIEPIAAYLRGGGLLRDPDVDVQSNAVTPSYFSTLRVRATIGRLFNEADDRPGADPVGVISHRLWQTTFGGDPGIVGRSVTVMNDRLTIVGVLQPGFEDVHEMRIDLWVPIGAMQSTTAPDKRAPSELQRPANLVARLRDSAGRDRAVAELQGLSTQFRQANGLSPVVLVGRDTRPLHDPSSRAETRQFMLLAPVLALVLVLVCANAGGLILARVSARHRELAVRMSLGASRWRVARQIFTEVLLLSLAAGGLGLLAARGVPALAGSRLRAGYLAPDLTVVAAAVVLSSIAAIAAAASALLEVRRMPVLTMLARRHGVDRAAHRARGWLVGTQMAISALALAFAGLLTRSVAHAASTDPGFRTDDVGIVTLVTGGDLSMTRRLALPGEWRAAVEALGLTDIAFAAHPPLSRSNHMVPLRQPGDDRSTYRLAGQRLVSSRYFDVLGIPIVEGRASSDEPGAREVVVSAQTARWLWPVSPAIGQRLLLPGGSDLAEHLVVGVAADVPTMALGTTTPIVYGPCGPCSVLIGRRMSDGNLAALSATARTIDAGARITHETVQDNVRLVGTADAQDAGTVAWVVGLGTLLLALVGAAGVTSYTIEERRREIGIRMALGGAPAQVAAAAIAGANRPALWGLTAGLLLAIPAALAVQHLVFGLEAVDPLAYALAMLVLLPTLLLSAVIPARRAVRVDPAVTLRHD